MRSAGVSLIVAAVVLLACGSERPVEKNVGDQTADISADTQTMREANLATAALVQAAGDCDTVKGMLPETVSKLDAIAPRIRTVAGRASLDGLRKRVREIADSCP